MNTVAVDVSTSAAALQFVSDELHLINCSFKAASHFLMQHRRRRSFNNITHKSSACAGLNLCFCFVKYLQAQVVWRKNEHYCCCDRTNWDFHCWESDVEGFTVDLYGSPEQPRVKHHVTCFTSVVLRSHRSVLISITSDQSRLKLLHNGLLDDKHTEDISSQTCVTKMIY